MGLFDKIKSCKVLKENSNAENEILELKEILETCHESEKINLAQTIHNLEYGIKGERAILFELRHSGFPMLVLQDLYLEHEDLSAQIDFLVLTRDNNYIIECKNMYGDVTVSDTGDFYRKINGKSNKIYSPITQCERHTEIIRKIRYETKSNLITKAIFEKFGAKGYCTLVVMANPTGKINTKYAPKDIRNKIVSVDQLVRYIKKNHNSKAEVAESIMIKLGEFFLNIHKNNPQNYMEKYRKLRNTAIKEHADIDGNVKAKSMEPETKTIENMAKKEQALICPRCNATMVLRVAKKGSNIGEEFYGCSNFPKCRYSLKKNKI